MIDHPGITVSDFDASKAFYDKAMAPLGASLLMVVPQEYTGGVKVGGYGRERPVFWIRRASGRRTTSTSPSPRAAAPRSMRSMPRRLPPAARTMAGRGCGPNYHPNYYGAFVFDPDGNNIEAVCHDPA